MENQSTSKIRVELPKFEEGKNRPMGWGCIAVLDVLGFKGIWSLGHDKIASQLSFIVKTIELYAAETTKHFRKGLCTDFLFSTESAENIFEFSAQAFSDSIIIIARVTNPRLIEESNSFASPESRKAFLTHLQFMCLNLVSHSSSICYVAGMQCEVPLPFRGAISIGSLYVHGTSFIGPAIDEAAEWMSQPQGAMIVLAPSAAAAYADWFESHDPSRGMFDESSKAAWNILVNQLNVYDVPIKQGCAFQTYVVNPLSGQDVSEQHLIYQVNRRMGSSAVDVTIKRQTTIAFLLDCKNALKES